MRAAVVRAAVVALIALGALAVLATMAPAPASAASPTPSSDIVGDTRSVGEGPGLVGAPFLAIGGVIALGLVSAGLTLAYVRATDKGRSPR